MEEYQCGKACDGYQNMTCHTNFPELCYNKERYFNGLEPIKTKKVGLHFLKENGLEKKLETNTVQGIFDLNEFGYSNGGYKNQ
jgi:hypothetical protein